MTRRELLCWYVGGCLLASCVMPHAACAQERPGRAVVEPSAQQRQPAGRTPQQRPPVPQSQQAPDAREQRPSPESIQVQIPRELEDLLIAWERESAKITRMRGKLVRYVYDTVYNVEKRAKGDFWYQAPDLGRIDFAPDTNLEPSRKVGTNGKPYTVQPERRQRWICTGKEIYIIDDDSRLYDLVQIPPSQQGKNIINSPLPFLFGLKAEQAKMRYHLSLGDKHNPRGPGAMIHVVAVPKLAVDMQEWSRAEVILDPATFVPRAIRLINPNRTTETVYVFVADSIRIGEAVWFNNPFNDRPPTNYTKGQESRAMNDAPAIDPRIAPKAASGPKP